MTLYEPSTVHGEPYQAPPSMATLATHHVLVPAAVILMVAALLFYLADVRSAFLGGGPALKWVGLCFAAATVLIERHRQTTGDKDLNSGIYTAALICATALVLLSEPWESQPSGFGGKLANLLILGVVWRFATQVTRGLSPEAGRHSPAVAVARLAALALLAFALGEPTLLDAAPQTGERALAAVVIFLFATGVTLAAASSMDTLRRVEGSGGSVASTLVPVRLAFAAGLMVVVLASALAVPGVEVRGTGRLRPGSSPEAGSDADRGYQEAEQGGGSKTEEETPEPQGTADEQGPQGASQGSGQESIGKGGASPFLLGALMSLGKWLLVPLILALLAAGLYALRHLAPRFAGWLSALEKRWRAWREKLAERFRRRGSKEAPESRLAPLEDLGHLADLPARDAVLAAYHALLAACGHLGHPRPERSTPYEFLQAFPSALRFLEGPARILTDLYVKAAYGPDPVPAESRDSALDALAAVKASLAAR